MAWRIVTIENPASLSFKNNKLVIKQDDEINVPLEDIDTLVLDSYGITLTQNLLAAIANNKISTIVCNEKHLPSALVTSYSQASRGSKNAKAQLNLPESTRKQLWRKNIMAKIQNQADVLKKYNLKCDDLKELAKTVRSGDVSNNESTAARLYFARLLEDSTRRKPMWHNSALDYGYAIIRSSIARSVAARGLVAMIGINHRSELNQYNLVDDLIESLRPFVDDYIMSTVTFHHIGDNDDANLTRDDRHLIIDILNQYGIINNKKYQIKHLCDKVVENFANAILEDSTEPFVLPSIIK